MARAWPISKITHEWNNQTQTANIGAAAEDVYITLTIGNAEQYISLNDFAKYLYDYFTNGTFVHYGENEPNRNTNANVKVWYKTHPQNE